MRRALVLAVLLVMLVMGPALVIVLIVNKVTNPPADVYAPEQPVLGVPIQSSSDRSISTSFTFTRRRAQPLVSSGGDGVITSVLIHPNAAIGPGDALYAVNGVRRLAYFGAVQFRTLRKGDSGPDVKSLQDFLAGELGLTCERDGMFGPLTEVSVRRLSDLVGAIPSSGVFRPEWLVRIPERHYPIGSVEIAEGSLAPAFGAVVVDSRWTLDGVAATTPLDGVQGRDFLFLTDGEELSLARHGDRWIADEADVMRLSAVLANTVDSQIVLQGTLRLAEAVPVQYLPAQALLADKSGRRLCVVVPANSGYRYLMVEVGRANLGLVETTRVLDPALRFVMNPNQAGLGPVCR